MSIFPLIAQAYNAQLGAHTIEGTETEYITAIEPWTPKVHAAVAGITSPDLKKYTDSFSKAFDAYTKDSIASFADPNGPPVEAADNDKIELTSALESAAKLCRVSSYTGK